MVTSTIYRCEYCGKEYLDKNACEACEASHGHNISLHKKLEKILKTHDVFYKYDESLNIIYIYKVKKIYNVKEEFPECFLYVEILEIYISAIYSWYTVRVNDCYNARYFIDDIENERLRYLENKKTCEYYTDIKAILEAKNRLTTAAFNEPIIKKYLHIKEDVSSDALNMFIDMFKNRKDLDVSITEARMALDHKK